MLCRACRAFHENERCLLPFVKQSRTRDSLEYSSLRARYILQSTSTSDLPAEFPVPLPKKLHDPLETFARWCTRGAVHPTSPQGQSRFVALPAQVPVTRYLHLK